MPFSHTEVRIEAVGHGVPGHLPTHLSLQPCYVGLRCARDIGKSRVARMQVSQMRNLVSHHRTTYAGVPRPAVHSGLEEGAIDDQLTTAFKEVEQSDLSLGALEHIRLLHWHPRHAPPLRGQRVMGA